MTGWKPSFDVLETDIACPGCQEVSVFVREKRDYQDETRVEAYCSVCRLRLTVVAYVEVTFAEPEILDRPLIGTVGKSR